MCKEQLISRVNKAFSAMVMAESERDYAYAFGQFNAYLSVLFLGDMISIDEYNALTNAKRAFYFSIVRNEVVFK